MTHRPPGVATTRRPAERTTRPRKTTSAIDDFGTRIGGTTR